MKREFKKIVSVLLALTFVFYGGVTSSVPVLAETTGANLVRNGGFENGSEKEAYDWGLWPGWDKGEFISTDQAHSGSRAIKVELSDSQNYALYAGGYTPEVYDTSASVVLSAWVRYENLTGGFQFGVERKANGENVAGMFSRSYTGSSNGWKEIILEVPATTLTIDETVIKFEIASGSGTLYIDDVSLTVNETQNILNNAGFEKGDDGQNWGCYNADTFITENQDEVHSGDRALKINQTADTYAFWSDTYSGNSVDTTKALTYSIWAKYENVSENGFKMIAECDNSDNISSQNYTGTSNGWIKLTFDVPVDVRRTGVRFKVEVTPGEGFVCFDDAAICVSEKQNFIKNGGFESGTETNWGLYNKEYNTYGTTEAYAGCSAIKVTLQEDHNFSVWSDGYDGTTFDVTQKMLCSIMMKYENMTAGNVYLHVNRGAGAQVNSEIWYLSGSSNGWVEMCFEVPADSNATMAQMQIEISNGSGNIWFDNASLTANSSELIDYASYKNASFESVNTQNGVIAASDWGLYPAWSENASISNEYRHSGANSLKITLSDSQNYAFYRGGFDKSEFDFNQALIVSAWINIPSDTPVTGDFYLGCERGRYDLIKESLSGYTTDGEWVRVFRVLEVNDAENESFVLKGELSQGTGTIYIDDIEIYPLPTISLTRENAMKTLTTDQVRTGDPIIVNTQALDEKVAHLWWNKERISIFDKAYQAIKQDDNLELKATYDNPIPGDANDDINVDLYDLVRIKRHISEPGTDICSLSADVYKDDTIDSQDVSGLREILLQKF